LTIHRLVLGELETNCYVLRAESGQGLIIDPADDADAICSLVSREDITPVAVVLTHAHFDHMLAAGELRDRLGVPLYVGIGDAEALSDPIRNLSGWFSPNHPVSLSADRTLTEGDIIAVGETAWTVMETPGHTPGCICLLGDGVLFSGDTLFCGSIGRLDFPGGDLQQMVASLNRLIQLPPDTVVYSGHGEKTTIGQEIVGNPYLR